MGTDVPLISDLYETLVGYRSVFHIRSQQLVCTGQLESESYNEMRLLTDVNVHCYRNTTGLAKDSALGVR